MKNLTKILTKLTMSFLAIVGINSAINAQCGTGEVEVFIDLTSDQWGYEMYWELAPKDSSCGGPATIFAAGNPIVGCLGDQGIATGSDPVVIPSSTTITYPDTGTTGFCLTIGNEYDIILVDDYGDAFWPAGTGGSFSCPSQGINWVPNDPGNATPTFIYSFTAISPPQYNLAAGELYSDPNGWEFDYAKPVYDKNSPIQQLGSSEMMMGITARNQGVQTATNVYARLSIDTMAGPGVYNTVFTDTVQFGDIASDSIEVVIKDITDTSWVAVNDYRYQYIIYQDSVDEIPASDTITNFFSITDNYWSRVDLLPSGFPNAEGATTSGTSSYIDGFEWGSMFYFPSGSNVKIDTFRATMYCATSATALTAPYQVRIYEVQLQGTALDLTTDLIQVGGQFDTMTVTPGSYVFAELTTILDFSLQYPNNFRFKDNTLYYVSVAQLNPIAPYLNDGTTRNGLYLGYQTENHDLHVTSTTTNSYPFYSPLIVSEAGVVSTYSYGFSSGQEPSIGMHLSTTITDMNQVTAKELEGVTVAPNPTSDYLNVNLALENATDVQYVLTDLSGKIIHIEKSFNVTDEVKTFDVSKYPAGVFLLNVITNDASTTKRIVKK